MKIIIFCVSTLFFLFSEAYVEEQIKFPIGNEVNLSGFVTSPNKKGTYPIFIMQMGHGQGTTDSKARSYNPFAEMARAISDKGFVVLRFDKRGTGYNSSNGSFADGKFSDYVSDLKSAVRAMQLRKNGKPNQIYLLGHSLGGPVVSIVARDIPEVKGIVLSASPGRSYDDFNYEQMKYFYEWAQGLTGEALEKEIRNVKRSNELISKPKLFCKEFPTDCETKDNKFYLYGQSQDFWAEIAELNPIKLLTQLNCNIYAVHGTSDWVISSDNDGGAIANALSKNNKFSNKILSGLDHFLLKTESKKASVEVFKSGLKGQGIKIHPELIEEITSRLLKWKAAN